MNTVLTQIPDLTKAMSYQEFLDLTISLFAEGKTTGENHSKAMLDYTEQNIHRIQRHDKHDKVSEESKEVMNQVNRAQTWLVINEAWCGDGAHSMPMMNKLAELSENIELRVILRDENLDIMDQYLTNGARSIPRLVAFDVETGEELWQWGPKPKPVFDILMEYKAGNIDYAEYTKQTYLWYGRDRNQTIQQEIAELVKNSL